MRISRTFDILDQIQDNYPEQILFADRINGQWNLCKGIQYVKNTRCIHYYFLSMGFSIGDKIMIMLPNCSEWNIFDMAISLSGCISVPIYYKISNSDLNYIFEAIKPIAVIVSNEYDNNKILKVAKETNHQTKIISIHRLKNTIFWRDLLSEGRRLSAAMNNTSRDVRKKIKRDDIASIIFTSGSQDKPKGILLTHKNLLANALSTADLHSLAPEENVVVCLSMSFAIERTQTYMFQYYGLQVFYENELSMLATTLRITNAVYLTVVPRVLEYLYEKAIQNLKILPIKKIKEKTATALSFTEKYTNENSNIINKYKLKIIRHLYLRSIKTYLGKNLRYIGCGGGKVQQKIKSTLTNAGIPVLEGYGLAENTATVACNSIKTDSFRTNTVGKIINGVDVKIDDKQQILIKGHSIAARYLNTDNTDFIDKKGWLHTGDIGNFNPDEFLVIHGRSTDFIHKKDGSIVNATFIEHELCASPYIKYALVYCYDKNYISALIIPNFIKLKQLYTSTTDKLFTRANILQHKDIAKLLSIEIGKINKKMPASSQIAKFFIRADRWSYKTGELTPTFEIRRHYLVAKYKLMFERLYENDNNL